MDYDKKYSCLERKCLKLKKTFDLENEFQQTLQQFSNDIMRVVKCKCHGNIKNISTTDDEVIVSGKIQIMLTYYNEDAVLSYADFEEDFSKSIAVDNMSQSAFATGHICDKYCSYRVVNLRKIDIHCSHSITICVYDSASNPFLASCVDSKLKYERLLVANFVNSSVANIEFDEEFSLTSTDVNRVIDTIFYASVVDKKVIKDKALIKMKISCEVVYTTGTNEEQIESSQFSFELSKIIEIVGIDEEDILIPRVMPSSIYTKLKNTTDSGNVAVEIYGDISLATVAVHQSEIEAVTDGYIINRRSDCSYEKSVVATDGHYISRVDNASVNLCFNNDICEIKCLELCISDYIIRDGKAILNLCASLLCTNMENNLQSYSAQSQIEIDMNGYDDAIASFCIAGYDYTISSSNSIDARISIGVEAFSYKNKTTTLMTDITINDDKIDYPVLTVYFAKQNESVWNIAKQFSSDKSLIIKENNLSDEYLDSNKILLIPGV